MGFSPNKKKTELQIIISFNKPKKAQQIDKERWQIETAFRGLKTSGFNIEDTHLTDLERIEELFSIVMIAFAWAYVVGVYKGSPNTQTRTKSQKFF